MKWATLPEFLSDPDLELAGYQINFVSLKDGLFYFSHTKDGCGTTLAVPVVKFAGLSNRPVLASRGKQPKCCPEFCLRQTELELCPAECECLWVREIMQIIRNGKKT